VYLTRNLYKKKGTLGSTPKRFDPLAPAACDFIVPHVGFVSVRKEKIDREREREREREKEREVE